MPVLIRFGRLGDMVLQTPLLHALHEKYGQKCGLITSGLWSRALFARNRHVQKIWQIRWRHAPLYVNPEHWWLIHELKKCTGPIYVSEDAPRQLEKIRWLIRMANVPSNRCAFLADYASTRRHWVDRLLELAELTPAQYSTDVGHKSNEIACTAPLLEIHDSDRRDRDAWLRARGLSGKKLVVIQAGNRRLGSKKSTSGAAKVWPRANWKKLFCAIRDELPDACILLSGSPAESNYLQDIRSFAAIDGVEIAARDLPLRRLMSILEIAHSAVAVDSGPAHVAAAVGCPLVVLYGSESPEVWGRRSACARPVVEIGGPPDVKSVQEIVPQAVIQGWRHLVPAHRYPDIPSTGRKIVSASLTIRDSETLCQRERVSELSTIASCDHQSANQLESNPFRKISSSTVCRSTAPMSLAAPAGRLSPR